MSDNKLDKGEVLDKPISDIEKIEESIKNASLENALTKEDAAEFLKYKSDDFSKILGGTSYYKAMQNSISSVVLQNKPTYVIELGSGVGSALSRIASENPQASFVGVEFDEELVQYCKSNTDYGKQTNLTFIKGDLRKLSTLNLANVDIVVLSYSFNYIEDPDDNKRDFLKALYNRIRKGTKVVVGDWFLNDKNTYSENGIKTLYKLRVEEGVRSLSWHNVEQEMESNQAELEEVSNKNVEFYKEYHKGVLKNLLNKQGIYPVSKQWLIETATEIGYTVEIDEYINNINDAVVVLVR